MAYATPIQTIARFRAEMIALAASARVDVAHVRHGFPPETLDAVSFDIVIGRSLPMRMLWEICAFRHEDGSYWLIPPVGGAGPATRIMAGGIALVLNLCDRDLDKRGDGASRGTRNGTSNAPSALPVTAPILTGSIGEIDLALRLLAANGLPLDLLRYGHGIGVPRLSFWLSHGPLRQRSSTAPRPRRTSFGQRAQGRDRATVLAWLCLLGVIGSP